MRAVDEAAPGRGRPGPAGRSAADLAIPGAAGRSAPDLAIPGAAGRSAPDLAIAGAAGRSAPDLAILGARVHTLDPRRPSASAVAVRGGRIAAVGDDAAVREACDARTEIVDGRGLTVTPGLVDCHQHPVLGAALTRGLCLSEVHTRAELLASLAAAPAEGGWVLGWGLGYQAFEGAPLDRALIDGALGGAPALLRLADCHTALASTRALELAGITAGLAPGVVAGAGGRATGELSELEAIGLAERAVPALGRAELARRTASLLRRMAAAGLTAVHVLDGAPGTLEVLAELEATGSLPLRAWIAPWLMPDATEQELEAVLARLRGVRGPLLHPLGVKLFLDGTIDGGTAWLREPDSRGESAHSLWSDPQRYARTVALAAAAGFPAVTHAIGDAAVAFALDAYAAAGRPARGRHRIEHVELLADRDAARFARLDVVASFQPTHLDWSLPDRSDPWSRRIGGERCAAAFRLRDVLDAGGIVALGSDWPIAGFDPRHVMAGARLRRPAGVPRDPYGPAQALSPVEALAGFTTGAAAAAGDERAAGRIRAGLRADLTAFAGDPLTAEPDDLPDLPVAFTLVDGRLVG